MSSVPEFTCIGSGMFSRKECGLTLKEMPWEAGWLPTHDHVLLECPESQCRRRYVYDPKTKVLVDTKCTNVRDHQPSICPKCFTALATTADHYGGGSHYWTRKCVGCDTKYYYDTYRFKLEQAES